MTRRHRSYLTSLLLPLLISVLAASCNVHEFPNPGPEVGIRLELRFSQELPQWRHMWKVADGRSVVAPDSARGAVDYGNMRYIIRAYTPSDNSRGSGSLVAEFVYFRDISRVYDAAFDLDLPAGDYEFKVWADLVEYNGSPRFYNADDYAEITLQGDPHPGNTDYRDAFRGYCEASLRADVLEHDRYVYVVPMERPLAKFEFVTSDLSEFIAREARSRAEAAAAAAALSNDPAAAPDGAPSRVVDLDDYRVEFVYTGYMPCAYNIFSDKPVDSAQGVVFSSKIRAFNETEASLGFDYVMVNHAQTSVIVQIAIYNGEDRRVSLTQPIEVPLLRDRHTVMYGSFLMQESTGGLLINPEFDGEHNIIIGL